MGSEGLLGLAVVGGLLSFAIIETALHAVGAEAGHRRAPPGSSPRAAASCALHLRASCVLSVPLSPPGLRSPLAATKRP